jgi:hypothetical protein
MDEFAGLLAYAAQREERARRADTRFLLELAARRGKRLLTYGD